MPVRRAQLLVARHVVFTIDHNCREGYFTSIQAMLALDIAMGQNQKPVPPVNIPIPTKIGSKMGGAPTPKWYHWF